MSISCHYKFLVLLPIEADKKIDALKRYFGIMYAGEVVARGIEMRRHDIPLFIKVFQEKLIKTLLAGDTPQEVMDNGFEKALDLLTNVIDAVMIGEMKIDELVITRTIGRDISPPTIHSSLMYPRPCS